MLTVELVHVCVFRYIRLHHFDKTYLTMPDLIPEDVKHPEKSAVQM